MAHLSIFKPGKFTSLDGQVYSFSESDLKASAKAYNPSIHEAPLVIGHPKTDSPSYGWVGSLLFDGSFLNAVYSSVEAKFSEWVNKRYFAKISASFYPPDSPNNPVPGVYYLRHVGFLGGSPPSVKGLPAPYFSDGDNSIIQVEFSEKTEVNIGFSCPPGFTVDSEQLALHQDILNYQESHRCDYETALFNVET